MRRINHSIRLLTCEDEDTGEADAAPRDSDEAVWWQVG